MRLGYDLKHSCLLHAWDPAIPGQFRSDMIHASCTPLTLGGSASPNLEKTKACQFCTKVAMNYVTAKVLLAKSGMSESERSSDTMFCTLVSSQQEKKCGSYGTMPLENTSSSDSSYPIIGVKMAALIGDQTKQLNVG